jgi:hypothetical protein
MSGIFVLGLIIAWGCVLMFAVTAFGRIAWEVVKLGAVIAFGYAVLLLTGSI